MAALFALAALALSGCGEEQPGGRDTTGPLADLTVVPDGFSRRDVGGGAAPDAGGPSPDGSAPNPDGGAPAMHPAIYVTGRTYSPLTPYVARELRKVVNQGPQKNNKVFSKIGASATKSTSFMHCFAGSNVDLAGRSELQKTIDHFKVNVAGGTMPYNRTSLCATVGWNAAKALAGSPSPLKQEVTALSPRFAVIMYGTNDIGYKNIHAYADQMLDIGDQLLGDGVIPIYSSIMPRDDSASADVEVPRYNGVVRAVAQALQVPFVDLHRELLPLPGHGLAGDNLHPSTYYSGGAKGCYFTAAGLRHGYNLRNLLTITTLHRLREVLFDNKAAPDPPGPKLVGDGSPQAPIIIDRFPFSDMRNTAASPHKNLSRYSGCNATQDESGGEYLYKLVVTKSTKIRAYVFDRGTVDIDLHLLDSTASEAGCIQRDHKTLVATLAPGTYYLALDTFVSGGSAKAGEYLLLVLEE